MHFELHRLELKGFKCSFRFLFWKVLGKRQIQESRDSSKSPGQKVNTQKNPSSSDLLWLAKKLFQRRRRRRTSQCFSAPQHGLVTGWAWIAALSGVTALSQHAVGLVLCFRILFWNQGPSSGQMALEEPAAHRSFWMVKWESFQPGQHRHSLGTKEGQSIYFQCLDSWTEMVGLWTKLYYALNSAWGQSLWPWGGRCWVPNDPITTECSHFHKPAPFVLLIIIMLLCMLVSTWT